MMAIASMVMLPVSMASYGSDLAIYKGSTKGKTSLMLMLDTSGSMGISSLVLPKSNDFGSPGDIDATTCNSEKVHELGGNMPGDVFEFQYSAKDNRTKVKKGGVLVDNTSTLPLTKGRTSFYKEVIINGVTVPYYVRGCGAATVDDNGKLVESDNNRFDRLSRLKDAILTLLADPNALKDEVRIGLGHFSASTDLFVGKTNINPARKIPLVDGHSGAILLPIAELTASHRLALAQKIAKFNSVDTTTSEDGTVVTNQKYSSQTPPLVMKASSGTPTAHAYAEAAAYMMGTQTRTQTITGDMKFIYDGTSFIVNEAAANGQPKQVYYICVEVGTDISNGLGYSGNVKQCKNAWPDQNSFSSNKLTAAVKNTIKIPYNNSWLDLTGNYTGAQKTAVDAAKTRIDGIAFTDAWSAYTKLPSGWRYGGWMKVDNQPMDIEPIAGLAWESFNIKINKDTTQYFRNLVSYRASPFTLDGINENIAGGFKYSADSTKTGAKYIAGGSTSSCDGNGIYFLTDGAPNSTKDSMARSILNDTLTTTLVSGSPAGTYGFSVTPSGTGVLTSPVLKSGLFAGETGGWEYIGEYAKKLLDPTKNPASMKIKTAVVGFGSSFEGLTQNTDGTYDCNSTTNLDIKNACLWGQKNAGYGEGGFYQANNADDIANSIIKFVQDLDVNFSSTSLGTISIPLDPLDQTKAMNTGFFPMIQPSVQNNKRTWLGNLKKYYVFNGTLTDSATGGNKVYKVVNNQQVINSDATDIWFNQQANNSLIDVGGALNKIPVPANFTAAENSVNNVSSARNIWVLNPAGNGLKKVSKTNLATDASAADAIGTTTEYSVKKRIALLNYLGYQLALPATPPAELTAATINALPIPASPYRYLGGVIHSTPLVVTESASIDAQDKVTSRKEYVVYGSMDGGLHVVDAANGLEKSVFVPDEILTNQPETLVNSGATGNLAYGVDAPWAVDNTFKVEASGSATKYIARNMNIYGGLRMGGSALYGLDISTPTAPSLKFKITPSTTGFSRLGQIWSKPVIANIRVKGKVEKVLIFGGGYDASVYENDTNKTVTPTGPTQGNALYIVKASDGTLLWSVSSSNTGTTTTSNTQKQDDVMFSVVGQPAVRDYNADGLTDAIWFADLGGQIFRVDLNNAAQAKSDADANLAVRTQTLAQLKNDTFTPRFYERPSTAVFKEGQNRFVLVTLGSGNRSYPLVQEPGLNKVYGIIDYDAASQDLEKSTFTPSVVVLPTNLITTGILGKTFSAANSVDDATALRNRTKKGWAFSLKSSSADGYVKAMEETQLINSDLYVSVYDPNALLGGGTANVCGGGVQGISTVHRVCMPYGNCAAYATKDNQGIIGVPLGPINSENSRKTQIVSPTAITAEKCVGEGCGVKDSEGNNKPFIYKQSRVIKPIRWYEW